MSGVVLYVHPLTPQFLQNIVHNPIVRGKCYGVILLYLFLIHYSGFPVRARCAVLVCMCVYFVCVCARVVCVYAPSMPVRFVLL